jgi:phosphatidylglycerophosphatase C
MSQSGASGRKSSRVTLAVFDVDETILRGDSFKWFCRFVAGANINPGRLGRFMIDTVKYLSGRVDAGEFKSCCLKMFLKDIDQARLNVLTREFFDKILAGKLTQAGLERLQWHKQQQHRVVFLSASPDIYLKDLCSRLGGDALICTKFLDQEGSFTGELHGANCKGEEKRTRLLAEYASFEVEWAESFGYGNSDEDIPFLEMLGNAVAVNPSRNLKRVAQQRAWKIEIWN